MPYLVLKQTFLSAVVVYLYLVATGEDDSYVLGRLSAVEPSWLMLVDVHNSIVILLRYIFGLV